MIRYLADVATPLHASGAQGTFSMDNCRTRCIQLSQEDVDKGTSRTTIRLGKGFSCLCGRFRCHNWKFFNAVVGAELVLASILCESEIINYRTQLFDN